MKKALLLSLFLSVPGCGKKDQQPVAGQASSKTGGATAAAPSTPTATTPNGAIVLKASNEGHAGTYDGSKAFAVKNADGLTIVAPRNCAITCADLDDLGNVRDDVVASRCPNAYAAFIILKDADTKAGAHTADLSTYAFASDKRGFFDVTKDGHVTLDGSQNPIGGTLAYSTDDESESMSGSFTATMCKTGNAP